MDETKPRFIALDIMITKLFYMFQSQIIPIGVQVVHFLATYSSNITQNRTSWGMFTYLDIFGQIMKTNQYYLLNDILVSVFHVVIFGLI